MVDYQERLRDALIADGHTVDSAYQPGLLLHPGHGVNAGRSLQLKCSESSLVQLLDSYGDKARDSWPSDSDREAAFKLFLVNLDELLTLRTSTGTITLSAHGIDGFEPAVAMNPKTRSNTDLTWSSSRPD